MIREAEPSDVAALVDLAEQMHAESRFAFMPFCAGRVAEMMSIAVMSPAGFARVIEQDGQIIGAMAGQIGPHIFSEALVAWEYGIFVKPEHRGGMAAVRLVKAFEDWAVGMGASLIDIGISTGIHTERTGRLYQRLGFSPVGVLFSKGG